MLEFPGKTRQWIPSRLAILSTRVNGIAVTMMATMDVLERAAASGHNLIITHEPTFYSHEDNPRDLPAHENDPVLAAKRKFMAEQGLVDLAIPRSLPCPKAGRN